MSVMLGEVDPQTSGLQVAEYVQTERAAREGKNGQDRERKSDSPSEDTGLSPRV